MTTRLLGFKDLASNSVYAQIQEREMREKCTLWLWLYVATTLGKLAADVFCLLVEILVFSDFLIGLPPVPVLCLIRKNPDIFELDPGEDQPDSVSAYTDGYALCEPDFRVLQGYAVE